MKKKVAIIFSLLLSVVMLSACTNENKLVKERYNNGIANFYQYFLTNYYSGIEVQHSRLDSGENSTQNNTNKLIIDGGAQSASALILGKEYMMSCLNTFISGSTSSDLYSYDINGTQKNFSVQKMPTPFTVPANNKSYSEYQVLDGFRLITKMYVRQDGSKFDVAVPVMKNQQIEYFLWTIEYDNGLLTMSIKRSNVVYYTELCFDTSKVLYLTLDIGNELHYELRLGTQSILAKYSVSMVKGSTKINYPKLLTKEFSLDDYAKQSRYLDTINGFYEYDGLKFTNNIDTFNQTIQSNNAVKVKYDAMQQVIDTLKG